MRYSQPLIEKLFRNGRPVRLQWNAWEHGTRGGRRHHVLLQNGEGMISHVDELLRDLHDILFPNHVSRKYCFFRNLRDPVRDHLKRAEDHIVLVWCIDSPFSHESGCLVNGHQPAQQLNSLETRTWGECDVITLEYDGLAGTVEIPLHELFFERELLGGEEPQVVVASATRYSGLNSIVDQFIGLHSPEDSHNPYLPRCLFPLHGKLVQNVQYSGINCERYKMKTICVMIARGPDFPTDTIELAFDIHSDTGRLINLRSTYGDLETFCQASPGLDELIHRSLRGAIA